MSIVRAGVLWVLAVLCAAGCAREKPAAADAAKPAGLRKVVFQTDWFPQAEHGGFYQALAKGSYREAGLDVEIRPGGPGVGIKVPVSTGDVDFGMNRSDDVMVVASRGLPLVMVAAVLQHDPQALMVHEASPVKSFPDLQGRVVTASVGMTWIPFIQKKYGVAFDLKPNTYSLAGFFIEPATIQQCFVTNEPFYAREKGVRVRLLPLADSGYDVYHTIICRRELLRLAPDMVRGFVAASLRGWRDYVEGDPKPAEALILQRNTHMTRELLAFSRGEMIARSLVSGDRAHGEDIGQLSLPRLTAERDVLLELKVMERSVPIESVVTRDFLPAALR
ncbi:MAG: ABC transporter substrate-binding protein [Verrucomicrobia bacterium]|nr:ABC transporter substrate-binding protein [Verrucomicrobiota bacterium]